MKRWSLIVLFWAALILGVYYLMSAENARRLSKPEGWDDIHDCGSLTSFDGTKTLDFQRSQKARLTERSPDDADKSGRKVDGTWSFDGDEQRYTVSFGNSSTQYALVKPEDASLCVLVPGDIGAANLRESWFGPKDE
jgi:hypothetical protein